MIPAEVIIPLKPVVYVDVLFLVNFLVNFSLLYLTGKILRLKIKYLRVFGAAGAGALYAVLMFLPELSFIYSTAAKIFSCFGIVAAAYNIRRPLLYFKTLGVFIALTLCFGGGLFALFCFTGIGAALGAVVKNGVLYLKLPWQVLFLAAMLLILCVFAALSSGVNGRRNNFATIHIYYMGKKGEVTALLDTGNTLSDPLSNCPVIVCEYKTLKNILPYEINTLFENGDENNFAKIEKAFMSVGTKLQIRLIPFSSIGRENGLLIGFKPDSVSVFVNEKEMFSGEVTVGICNNALSDDKSFQALINPGVLS